MIEFLLSRLSDLPLHATQVTMPRLQLAAENGRNISTPALA